MSQHGPITVNLVGQTAVLQGTVASDADRQLAEDLARLEPGVMAVQNDLAVVPAPLPAEVLPLYAVVFAGASCWALLAFIGRARL